MTHNFSKLEAKMSAEAIARSDKRYRETLAAMPLHELRRARGLSQETLAHALRIKQPKTGAEKDKPDLPVATLLLGPIVSKHGRYGYQNH